LDDYVMQVEASCPKDRPFALIGASMGGPIALRVAQDTHPLAVVLVNGVSPKGNGKKMFPKVVRWANGPIKDTRDSMPDSDETTIQMAWKRWRDESGAVLSEITAGVHTKKPSAPLLFVISTNDTDVPPETGRALAREYKADHFEYAGMSHVGPLLGRRAPEVAQTVLDWLTERTKSG
jgi:pimeloyl-ACP methyl ester carboxylesterase